MLMKLNLLSKPSRIRNKLRHCNRRVTPSCFQQSHMTEGKRGLTMFTSMLNKVFVQQHAAQTQLIWPARSLSENLRLFEECVTVFMKCHSQHESLSLSLSLSLTHSLALMSQGIFRHSQITQLSNLSSEPYPTPAACHVIGSKSTWCFGLLATQFMSSVCFKIKMQG